LPWTEGAPLTCALVDERQWAEEYLGGRLSREDSEAFEAHFFECPVCLERLEALEAVRAALATEGQTSSRLPSHATPRRASVRAWAWLGAAAGIAAMGVLTWQRSPAPPLPALPTPAVPTDTRLSPRPSLADLGRFEPPPYHPTVLRGPSASSGLFRDAMRRYHAGDCAGALPGLESAARVDPAAAEPLVFLGICRLLTGRTAEGNESLRRAIAKGDTPYLEWAHFYLAKGLLLAGDGPAAGVQLERAIALRGDLEDEARRLREQVRAAAANH